ncbi:MAG: MotA/TolQ/ExbB proton channel family protein [Gammaproteobacteria bacterium]|nr:MotA/TolQ/ExbB proton channel family protein [Gammaproteobacteria bacterium]
MTRTNWIAVILFACIFISSFMYTENSSLFINGLGMVIVLSGTLGAIFLSYPAASIGASVRVARNSYTVNPATAKEIVDALIFLSVHSRQKGVLALEDMEDETTITFLKRALAMMVDGYNVDELRDILYTEMYYFKQRRLQHERLFHHAARLAPAFGVAGSVIGLIAMLAGIGDPDVILKTIPIALTSTLYGIVLSNFFLTPIAENIKTKTQQEIMMQKLITDGVIAIRQEQNPVRLITKLESFLTPAARSREQLSFEAIREQVQDMRSSESMEFSEP